MPTYRARHACLMLPTLLGLAACATPAAVPADAAMPLPDRWAVSEAPPAHLELAQYWTMLGDPLLTEFVEAAIAGNLDLAQGAARLEPRAEPHVEVPALRQQDQRHQRERPEQPGGHEQRPEHEVQRRHRYQRRRSAAAPVSGRRSGRRQRRGA